MIVRSLEIRLPTATAFLQRRPLWSAMAGDTCQSGDKPPRYDILLVPRLQPGNAPAPEAPASSSTRSHALRGNELIEFLRRK